MRTMKKAFLSGAVVAAAALIATAPAMATGLCPTLGTPTVISGPCPVVDAGNPVCAGTGVWTGIQYQIPGALPTDYVSTLVTVNNTVLPTNVAAYPAGYTLQPACTAANGGGDLTTDLGEYSCHERALRVKVNTDGTFWVLVLGTNKQPLPTSISQRRGLLCPPKSTQVVGLGLDLPVGCVSTCGNFNAKQAVTNLQIVQWEGCVITKHFDATTGAFLGVSTDTAGCSVQVGDFNNPSNPPKPVSGLTLSDGTGSEQITFGDGSATSGDNSCFSTFVGGVYSRVCR